MKTDNTEGPERGMLLSHPEWAGLEHLPAREFLQAVKARDLEVAEMREIARLATRKALEDYQPIAPEVPLDLTVQIEGGEYVFQLFGLTESCPPVVFATARVNPRNRSVAVKVSGLALRSD
ncbi:MULTISPECIES: hypothetical protein [unclassified Acidovorax]|uniref:hypothetical protein n=1 Tax=unclassified Acidovorax TaxID=2684926 RepID=UPI0012E10632|nr:MULTISPECIES: hypothetical protein [unclassified Acidovorax]